MDQTFFCTIENDSKSLDIVKLYQRRTMQALSENEQLSILLLTDNEIQKQEIEVHLYLNGVHPDFSENEKLNWILKYGKSFRTYLNTLKILFLLFRVQNLDVEQMSFEEFCRRKEDLNRHKGFLDIIHL